MSIGTSLVLNYPQLCNILMVEAIVCEGGYIWKHSVQLFYKPQFSHSVMSDSLRPHGLQHVRPPCSSPNPEAYSNSSPLSL